MSAQTHRLPIGGRIDRAKQVEILVDGHAISAHPGDTVASAMLANGRIEVGNSLYRGRPRGVVAAGVEEPNALLQVAGQCSESMIPATTLSVVNALAVDTLSGLGRLAPDADEAVYDKKYVHTDVLVIGAGPAGLAAALAAARTGARVVLLDDQPEPGGSLLSGSQEQVDGAPALNWVNSVIAELTTGAEVVVLPRTTAFGSYEDNYVLAVQHRTDHLDEAPAAVSRQRLWHIRATRVVIATGAHERPLVFSGNDRPGVMLASAVRTYLNRYAVRAGTRVVVATTNDSAYDLVEDLLGHGIDVPVVIDARSDVSARAAACGAPVVSGSVVVATHGETRITSLEFSGLADSGELTGEVETVQCDALAVSGGWSPVVHLHSQRQGTIRWDEALAAFVPDAPVSNQHVVGSAAGDFDLDSCLAAGWAAGGSDTAAPRGGGGGLGTIRPVWLVPGVAGQPGSGTNTSSTCSATRRSPTCGARRVRACEALNTSSATPRSAPRTTRAKPRPSTPSV
ncbi:MAG: FAD-dependent oxidoreductase [Nocardioidaceae bacterium]